MTLKKFIPNSAAASGWAGWALAHPEFGSSVNPITTRGADYNHIAASPPGFENSAASLLFRKFIELSEILFLSSTPSSQNWKLIKKMIMFEELKNQLVNPKMFLTLY